MKKILLMSAFLMTSYFASAQTLLRVKQQKGDKYTQETVIKQTISVMGMDMPQNTTIKMSNEVTEASSKEITIKSIVKRFYLKSDNPMMPMEYDSDKPDSENSAELAQLSKMKGKSFLKTIDERGKVINADGGDLQYGGAGTATIFPEKAINVGGTWTGQSEIKNAEIGDLVLHNTYTLSKVVNGIAHIDVKSIYKNAEKKEIGTQKGSFQVLLSSGLTISASLEQDMEIDINGQVAGIKSKITITTEK